MASQALGSARGLEDETETERSSRWTIAAVIPTHNRAGLIERAIDSALDQLRPPDEVIVVDDGSTDNTADVIARYGDRVRLITKEQGGVSSARNLGVEGSRSDYVAFLDSDDLWEPTHLLRMEQAIEGTNGQAILYFSDLRLGSHYPTHSVWEPCGFEIEGPFEVCADGRDWLFGSRQPMLIPASVVQRAAYLAVGGSDTRLVCRGDTHLFFKLGMSGPMCAVAGFAGHATRDDPTSVSTTLGPGFTSYLNCTIWLYEDLLRTSRLTRLQRTVMRRRIAAAHWDFAKHWGLKAPLAAVESVLRATRYDPPIILRRLRSRAAQRFQPRSVRSPRDASTG